ncbi:hypothetical protein LSAT2_003558, partial [Lamellibrachia satsuma]
MGSNATEEKPSQLITRFLQVGGTWYREDIEHWAFLRRLPPSLCTSPELHTPQLSMEELLQNTESLYVTLPPTIIAIITKMPAEHASAVHA